MRTIRWRTLFVLVAAAACSADTGLTSPSEERDLIAARLAQMADSIALESDATTAEPYRELADLVRRVDHPSLVRLAVDGEPLPFSAVAQETIVTTPCVASTSESSGSADACTRGRRMRSLLAWHAPSRRIVMLTTFAERGTFGAPDAVAAANVAPVAQLRFFDESGRASFAISGAYGSAVETGDACAAPRRSDVDRATVSCLLAQFKWQLEATTLRREGARESAAAATPAVTHTLRLASSLVGGTQVTISAPPPPPAPPAASPLVVSLRTHVDSIVTLAFVVRNESDAPVSLRFPTAQQHDFAIVDRAGTTVWRWSDGKAFGDAPTTRTIPAHESISFGERWRPTAHGELIVVATMTSTTQRVSARAALTVP